MSQQWDTLVTYYCVAVYVNVLNLSNERDEHNSILVLTV